ncbi:MAG: hypothetical protein ABFD77_04085 [Thermotogota bacterium]
MSAIGHSATIQSGAGGTTPPAGDVNIFLDVTAGSDAATGAAWATALRTWEKAESVIAAILSLLPPPTTAQINLYVRNGTHGAVPAGSKCLAPSLPDRVRLNVVCPVDQWLSVNPGGLIGIAACTAEAGSGLANIVVSAPFLVGATDQGLFAHIHKGTESIVTPILAVDTVGNAYVVGMTDAVMPIWVDDDGLTEIDVLQPDSVVNGAFTFAPIAAPVGEDAAGVGGVVAPKCWCVGIRANLLEFAGTEVAAAACTAYTAGAVVPDGQIGFNGPDGVRGAYTYELQGGVPMYLDPAKAVTWGLIGTTPVVAQTCGCCCEDLGVLSGTSSTWSGLCVDEFIAGSQSYVVAGRCAFTSATFRTGAHGSIHNFRGPGTGAHALVESASDGASVEVGSYNVVGLLGGPRAIFEAVDGGQIVVTDAVACLQAILDTDLPLYGYFANGGEIVVEGSEIPDDVRAQYHTVAADRMGKLDIRGKINLTTPRPGGNGGGIDFSDINIINGSTCVLADDIIKAAPNTAPSCCLNVDNASHFIQRSGNFTFGNAPADWTADYGNLGLVHVANGSDAIIGILLDTGVGAGAGIAIQVRRRSSLWFVGNSNLTGAATTKVGVKAAAAFPAAAVLNDLPAAPDGAEELCVVGVLASP